MTTLYPNTFPFHNFYVDELMHLLTPEENVVLLFTARELYAKFTGTQNLSCGTGLPADTEQQCLDNLLKYGILIEPGPGVGYKLTSDQTLMDIKGLIDRKKA